MIARLWHGVVPAQLKDAYLDLMQGVAIPDYRGTPGNLGAFCLCRDEADGAHFEMLSFWRDEDAIRAFAGDDIEVARYYPFDDHYLVSKEPHVRHMTAHGAMEGSA